VYKVSYASGKEYVVAPAVPLSVETTTGVPNCQHSSAEWFCALVDNAVVVRYVLLDDWALASAKKALSTRREYIMFAKRGLSWYAVEIQGHRFRA